MPKNNSLQENDTSLNSFKDLNYKKAKNNWKKLINDFKHALSPDATKYLGIDLNEPSYLAEISRAKDNFSSQVKFTPKELKKFEITFDKKQHIFLDHEGKPVSTFGIYTKDLSNSLAFVLKKDGTLLIGPHSPLETHASYANGDYLMGAGLISIIKGKIKIISPNTGHYKTGVLNLYNTIKYIEKHMGSGAFSTDMEVAIRISSTQNKNSSLKEFLEYMETPDEFGKSNYNKIVENITQLTKEYETWLKAKPLILEASSEYESLGEVIDNLTNEELQELNKELIKTPAKIIIKRPNVADYYEDKTYEAFTTKQLMHSLLENGEFLAIKKLVENTDIVKLKDFYEELKPLYYVIKNKPNNYDDLLDLLLNCKAIKQLLLNEATNTKLEKGSSLHLLVRDGQFDDIININKILTHPEGRALLHKKDSNNDTPLQIAKSHGDLEIIALLGKYDHSLKKEPSDKIIIELSELCSTLYSFFNKQGFFFLETFKLSLEHQNSIVIKDITANYIEYNISELIPFIKNDINGLSLFLQAGISQYPSFQESKPIFNAVKKYNEDNQDDDLNIIKLLLSQSDDVINTLLTSEVEKNADNTFHLLAKGYVNKDIIKKFLQFPIAPTLLTTQNCLYQTPLDEVNDREIHSMFEKCIYKDYYTCKIENLRDISGSLQKLSPEEKQALFSAIDKNDYLNFTNANGYTKYGFYTNQLFSIHMANDEKLMQSMLNAGISKTNKFFVVNPLLCSVYSHKKENVKLLINNLSTEEKGKLITTLVIQKAIELNDNELLKEILTNANKDVLKQAINQHVIPEDIIIACEKESSDITILSDTVYQDNYLQLTEHQEPFNYGLLGDDN